MTLPNYYNLQVRVWVQYCTGCVWELYRGKFKIKKQWLPYMYGPCQGSCGIHTSKIIPDDNWTCRVLSGSGSNRFFFDQTLSFYFILINHMRNKNYFQNMMKLHQSKLSSPLISSQKFNNKRVRVPFLNHAYRRDSRRYLRFFKRPYLFGLENNAGLSFGRQQAMCFEESKRPYCKGWSWVEQKIIYWAGDRKVQSCPE